MSKGSGGGKNLFTSLGIIFLLTVSGVMMLFSFPSNHVNCTPVLPGQSPTPLPEHNPTVVQLSSTQPSAADYLSQFSAADQVDMKKYVGLMKQIAQERGLPPRAAAIVIATAMQESNIQNLDGGDGHSHGLLQQQWTQGWGTLEETLDPVHEINAFYDHLVAEVPNWSDPTKTPSMMEIANIVQKPNYQDYLNRWQWDKAATELAGDTGQAPATPLPQCKSKDELKGSLSPGNGALASSITQSPYVLGDDYPYASWPIRSETPTGLARECVDFVEWRLNERTGTTNFSHVGNAVDWASIMSHRGYIVDDKPAIGAVVWFDAGAGDPRYAIARENGHVAIESGYNEAKGTIILEQYNSWQAPHQYNVVEVPAHMPGVKYIHIADIPQTKPAMATSPGWPIVPGVPPDAGGIPPSFQRHI